jgi:hypothetical protein
MLKRLSSCVIEDTDRDWAPLGGNDVERRPSVSKENGSGATRGHAGQG